MYLYKFDTADVKKISTDSNNEIEVKEFSPSLRKLFLKGEKVGIKAICVRLMFQLITFGKACVYYVQSGEKLVHTSYVIPACAKFPFMESDELEIGPCYTYPDFRGKGIYPKVLSEICRRRGSDAMSFYMIVDETNIPSIKGIERAGFVRCGTVHKSKFSKRYYLDC